MRKCFNYVAHSDTSPLSLPLLRSPGWSPVKADFGLYAAESDSAAAWRGIQPADYFHRKFSVVPPMNRGVARRLSAVCVGRPPGLQLPSATPAAPLRAAAAARVVGAARAMRLRIRMPCFATLRRPLALRGSVCTPPRLLFASSAPRYDLRRMASQSLRPSWRTEKAEERARAGAMGNEQTRQAVAGVAEALQQKVAPLAEQWEAMERRAEAAEQRMRRTERTLALTVQKMAGERLDMLVLQRVQAAMQDRVEKLVAEHVQNACIVRAQAQGGAAGARAEFRRCARLDALERRVAALESLAAAAAGAGAKGGAGAGAGGGGGAKAMRRLETRVAAVEASLRHSMGWLLPRVDRVVTDVERRLAALLPEGAEVPGMKAVKDALSAPSLAQPPPPPRRGRPRTPSPSPSPSPDPAAAPAPGKAPPRHGKRKATPTPATPATPAPHGAQLFAHALMEAAENGQLEQVQALLRSGADVNCRDAFGRTPLHAAARGGHEALVDLFIASGAAVDVADNIGWTPLHVASTWGYEGCAARLLAAGASVAARGEWGRTALHCAVYNDSAAAARLLLGAGADASARDSLGRSPRDLAETHSLCALLQAHAPDPAPAPAPAPDPAPAPAPDPAPGPAPAQ